MGKLCCDFIYHLFPVSGFLLLTFDFVNCHHFTTSDLQHPFLVVVDVNKSSNHLAFSTGSQGEGWQNRGRWCVQRRRRSIRTCSRACVEVEADPVTPKDSTWMRPWSTR